ncbi:MAG: DUF6062 family protein [Anaerolineae bacterium]|nr:DUF6062 family protein [Anaerolineae bacterium]
MAEKDVLYHELLDALRADGCAICRLARKASDRYINALLYEGVVDVDLRQKLRDARGPCYVHAWRMAGRRGAVLGTAIVYRDVINTLVKALEAPEKRSLLGGKAPLGRGALGRGALGRGALPQRLAATESCPACSLEQDAVRRAIKTLLKHANDADIAASYVAAGGLCLPHFTETLTHANGAASQSLAEWQAAALQRLRAALDELIRKHDYRFSGEAITEQEAVAWTRAVAAAVGEAELLARE